MKSLNLWYEILWPKSNYSLKSLDLAQCLNLRNERVLTEAIS